MKGKIGIEEHMAIPETYQGSRIYFPDEITWQGFVDQIGYYKHRLKQMDKYGYDMTILSTNSPSVQEFYDARKARDAAKKTNDVMAEWKEKYPKRFQALACLAMQDVDAAINEMHRCIKELGFVGVLLNGYSNVNNSETAAYLDEKQFWPFWEELEKLDAPLYIHPREPLPANQGIYKDHPWLLAAQWAFGVETATHALRIMCSGLLDEYPKVKIILGHLGETLPFCIWRADYWIKRISRGIKAKRPIQEYFNENFWVTTSGQFCTQALTSTMMEMGSDRILYATDYPFNSVEEAATWFDACPISEHDRIKIGRTNSINLFKLHL